MSLDASCDISLNDLSDSDAVVEPVLANQDVIVIPHISLTDENLKNGYMIDWISAVLPYEHAENILGGYLLNCNADGELIWEQAMNRSVPGSFSSSVQIKSVVVPHGAESAIWISGNPAKFLRGHNVSGSTDIRRELVEMTLAALSALGRQVQPPDIERWLCGDFTLRRVDINRMIHCGSRFEARSVLRRVAGTGCMKYSGRGEFSGDTLYFAKKSRRRSIKMYCKGDELSAGRGHALPSKLDESLRLALLAQADDAIRVELTLRSQELKRIGFERGSNWSGETARELYLEHVSRIELPENSILQPAIVDVLKRPLKLTYMLWSEGKDPRRDISPATYYKHRAALRSYGIDIGSSPLWTQ